MAQEVTSGGPMVPPGQVAGSSRNQVSVRNVLLLLDGQVESRVAIPVSVGFAHLYGGTLHVVCSGGKRVAPEARLAEMGVPSEEMPGVVVDQVAELSAGSILELARSLPRPLIVASATVGNFAEPGRFGSIVETILLKSPRRIVLVSPEYARQKYRISAIILAHDGTLMAGCTVGPTAELAARARARVTAVYVAAPGSGAPLGSGSLSAPQYIDHPQHEWPSWVGEFRDRMLALGAPASDLKFKLIVRRGLPGAEIALIARRNEADLVVMGNPDSWERSRRVATRQIIRTSGCPVLLLCPEPGVEKAVA